MATLMVTPSGGSGGWSKSTQKTGKVSKKLKSMLKMGRGAVRGAKRAPEVSLKDKARELAAMSPRNDSEAEMQLVAQQWLKNKRG